MIVEYTKQALKALKSYDKPTREMIRSKIQGLLEIPPIGDIKPLLGHKGIFRLRVGKYRVLYQYNLNKEPKILTINKIDSRGDIYK